jgi:hypothetical protein
MQQQQGKGEDIIYMFRYDTRVGRRTAIGRECDSARFSPNNGNIPGNIDPSTRNINKVGWYGNFVEFHPTTGDPIAFGRER